MEILSPLLPNDEGLVAKLCGLRNLLQGFQDPETVSGTVFTLCKIAAKPLVTVFLSGSRGLKDPQQRLPHKNTSQLGLAQDTESEALDQKIPCWFRMPQSQHVVANNKPGQLRSKGEPSVTNTLSMSHIQIARDTVRVCTCVLGSRPCSKRSS